MSNYNGDDKTVEVHLSLNIDEVASSLSYADAFNLIKHIDWYRYDASFTTDVIKHLIGELLIDMTLEEILHEIGLSQPKGT